MRGRRLVASFFFTYVRVLVLIALVRTLVGFQQIIRASPVRANMANSVAYDCCIKSFDLSGIACRVTICANTKYPATAVSVVRIANNHIYLYIHFLLLLILDCKTKANATFHCMTCCYKGRSPQHELKLSIIRS